MTLWPWRVLGAIWLPILFVACSAEPDSGVGELPEQVTFNEHIAPIVHQNCMLCLRPNSAGPFNLISYQDVSKRAFDTCLPGQQTLSTGILLMKRSSRIDKSS